MCQRLTRQKASRHGIGISNAVSRQKGIRKMMTYNEAMIASLDQLTDELAAAGWDSTQTEILDARLAVVGLIAETQSLYAIVSDCTPNNGTIEAISQNAGELIDQCTDDTWRAIRLAEAASVGDRISVDWDTQAVNLPECC
jgi:hypothetical protein